MKTFTQKELEELEKNYLDEIVFLLDDEMDKLLKGLNTKESIRGDWEKYWGANTSDSATGAERIYYWIFNQFGKPNSAPVGSDLFFERKDAFVHIDIKTVGTDNVGDASESIFAGDNQNSYIGHINTKGEARAYQGQLPVIYTKITKNKIEYKPCLTYFIVLLHDSDTHELILMYICCMPNGILNQTYGDKVLKAGKNKDKIRFNFKNTMYFENLKSNPSRINVLYYNKEKISKNKKLKLLNDIIDNQKRQ